MIGVNFFTEFLTDKLVAVYYMHRPISMFQIKNKILFLLAYYAKACQKLAGLFPKYRDYEAQLLHHYPQHWKHVSDLVKVELP